MTEKLCVICLKAFNGSVVAVAVYELDDRIDNPPCPHGILSRPYRPPVRREKLGLCTDHEEYFREGLVAVIEIEMVRNQEEYNAVASKAEGRTGRMLQLPKEIILSLADFPPNNAVVFCEREPFERIKETLKDVWSQLGEVWHNNPLLFEFRDPALPEQLDAVVDGAALLVHLYLLSLWRSITSSTRSRMQSGY